MKRKVKIKELDETFKYVSKPNEWYKAGSEVKLEANCEGIGGLFRGTILITEDHGHHWQDRIGKECEDGELCPWDEFDIFDKDGNEVEVE